MCWCIAFKNLESDLTDFDWIQSVRYTTNGKTKTFNDLEIADDDKEFYYTDKQYNDKVGRDFDFRFDECFYDGPNRQIKQNVNQKWEGELSLVGRDKDGVYRPISKYIDWESF